MNLASSTWPAWPGGGPISRPSSSTQACASLAFGSRGKPITTTALSPCARSSRKSTRALTRQVGRRRPRRSVRSTARARRAGSCRRTVRRPVRLSHSTSVGSGTRCTAVRTTANQNRTRAPSQRRPRTRCARRCSAIDAVDDLGDGGGQIGEAHPASQVPDRHGGCQCGHARETTRPAFVVGQVQAQPPQVGHCSRR